MSDAKIYFNPNCSKCRQTLEILESEGVKLEIQEYLQSPPTVEELKLVLKTLKLSPKDITRTKETLYTELDLENQNLSEEDWLKVLHDNPQLIERPIVVLNGKAVVARPAEKVREIL